MVVKSTVLAGLLFWASCALAGTGVIGSATVRGAMQVDGYPIQGNATLFDGTQLATGQNTAILRLDHGTRLLMGTDSRGTLYRDRMVLEHGRTELTGFNVEANGLRVIPNASNAKAVVSVNGPGSIEIAALAGGLQVIDGQGTRLASLHSGEVIAMSAQAAGGEGVIATGVVTQANGHYYVTDTASNLKYELTGIDGLDKWVGVPVQITGRVNSALTAPGGTTGVVVVSSVTYATTLPKGPGGSPASAVRPILNKGVWEGALIAAGAGAALATYAETQSASP